MDANLLKHLTGKLRHCEEMDQNYIDDRLFAFEEYLFNALLNAGKSKEEATRMVLKGLTNALSLSLIKRL
jgi:hypothetical protein